MPVNLSEMARLMEPLVYPLGLFWLVLVAATLWLLARKRWRAALGTGAMSLFLYLGGATSIPARLLASLERPYVNQSWDEIPTADAVVLLGGTLSASAKDPMGFDCSLSVDRVLAAAELIRRGKSDVLVVGGKGGSEERPSESQLIGNWLESWGIQAREYIRLKPSLNTHDEAEHTMELVRERGWRRVLLVTSARHMRRAAATFRTAGVPIHPVACDFVGTQALEQPGRFAVAPQAEGFNRLELYLHEVVGWYYYRWQGRIREGEE